MRERLCNNQIVFVIFGTIVGYGVMSLPKDIAQTVGTSGWFSLLISTAVTLLILNIIVTLNLQNEDMTLDQYSRRLIGNLLTKAILLIYIIYFFIAFSMIARISCEVTKLSILHKTPVWALVFILMLLSCYAVYKKLTAISNISIIYGIIIIVFAIVIHLSMLTQGELVNIRPLFYPINLKVLIKSFSASLVPFLGVEILVIIPINKKVNRKIRLHTSLMVLFIGLFYILVVESCISVMGVEGIIHYRDALISTIRRIDLEYLNVFRRLDGLFIIAWTMAIFCTIVFFQYGVVFFTTKIFTKARYGYVCIIVTLLAFVFALLPQRIEQIQMILKYLGYMGGLTALIIPLLLFIISGVKRNANKNP